MDGTRGIVTGNGRTIVSDAAYQILVSDTIVAITSISAARTMTLPAASAYPVGRLLTIIDESGSSSATNTRSSSKMKSFK